MNTPEVPAQRPRSLTQAVVDKLTADIHDGRLPPGQKLPTEAAIMAELGVSRTVVREAISRLQAAGLAQTRHGIGTFVQLQNNAPAFRIGTHQLGTLRDVIALLELRISVETEAAALAAVRRSEANLAALSEAMAVFSDAVEQGLDAVVADFQFHREIARATQNQHFMDLLQSLGTQAIPRARLDNPLPVEPLRLAYLRRVNQEHESIYNAIQAQDPEAARAAMRTHLSNSRDRLKKGESTATHNAPA